MKLVVIESPGKRETLQKYLGKDYLVMSSKGHVRDLPSKSFAVDLTKNYEPHYEIMPDKKNVIAEIKNKAKNAELVLLATDPDREGEAIAWHLAYCLGIDPNTKCRIVFNEISKTAVERALLNPRAIDLNLVDAQQARRILDRIMGYKLSPILCKKIQPKLSAGRVQSVCLRLVVDREKEIENFVPEEYWNLTAQLKKQQSNSIFKASLHEFKDKKVKLSNKDEVDEVLENLKNATYKVDSIKKSKTKSKAPAPFTTSTMQQEALNKLNMTLKRTTSAAQQLYEGIDLPGEGKVALITYIRTDSVRISDDAIKMARDHIKNNFGDSYVPAKPNIFTVKATAQDAHEAIRPISLQRSPDSIKNIANNDVYKLYKLIYERFVACQMSEALYDSVTALIKAEDCTFKAVGKTLDFAGWTAMYKNDIKDDDQKIEEGKLPKLEEGEVLELDKLLPEQKFTKPLTRYTEATLVKAMEEKGIGRPSTYAPTVTIIASREYTKKDGKYIVPTEIGRSVTGFLEKYFNKMINVKFTAYMETKLDEIAEDKCEWQTVIDNFWHSFKDLLDNANFNAYVSPKKEPIKTDIICDKCGSNMVIREGKYGKFLGCSNYPNCKNIKPYEDESVPKGVCPECGKEVLQRKSKKGKIFYACTGYPQCSFMSWDIPTGEKCPKCNSPLVIKGKKVVCSSKQCKYVKE
mgnify:CR=1 FL=1